MSDSAKLHLFVVTFAVSVDTLRRYWRWREGELDQDDNGELRPVRVFELAAGIALVLSLLFLR